MSYSALTSEKSWFPKARKKDEENKSSVSDLESIIGAKVKSVSISFPNIEQKKGVYCFTSLLFDEIYHEKMAKEMDYAINRIDSLKELKTNWDGEGASKIDKLAIEDAKGMVRRFVEEGKYNLNLDAGPMYEGGVFVELINDEDTIFQLQVFKNKCKIFYSLSDVLSLVTIEKKSDDSYEYIYRLFRGFYDEKRYR